MPLELLQAFEAAINGLSTGIMYALVALGFVLIFKASGIFNFAQGVMALFAALTLVGLQSGQVPFAHIINATFGTSIRDVGWPLVSWPGAAPAMQSDNNTNAKAKRSLDMGSLRRIKPVRPKVGRHAGA